MVHAGWPLVGVPAEAGEAHAPSIAFAVISGVWFSELPGRRDSSPIVEIIDDAL